MPRAPGTLSEPRSSGSGRVRAPAGVVLACGLIVSACSTCVAGGPTIPDDVKQSVRARVEAGESVGIVVGVVDPGGTSYYCYGTYSKKDPRKVDENTLYEIGSVTKVFTALLLADCVRRGELGLDDPVAKHLPSHVKVPRSKGKQITLRHLATHRSGLPRMPSNFAPKDKANPYADYTVDRLYAFLAACELEHDVGAKYLYSNLAVGLLGNALSHACKRSYEQLVVERICRPLGMTDTRITLSPEQWRRMARGHAGHKEAKNWDIPGLAGAGALRASAKDMLRFIAANLGLVKTALSPAIEMTHQGRHPTGSPGVAVALGWHVSTLFGADVFWHNGGTGGYHSFCGFALDRKLGVVVLSNSTADVDDVGLHVLAPKSPLREPKKTVRLAASVLDRYVGYYRAPPRIQLHITREGDNLSARVIGQPACAIYPESETKFFYKIVDAQITFVKDDKGEVTGLVLHQGGVDHKFRKLPPDYKPPPKPKRVEVPVEASVLAAYVGKYELAPGAVFDVKLVKDKLWIKLTGQARLPVFAESDTKFFYKVVDAQITFVKDDTGKVTKLILHQSGMDRPAKKIE